MYFRTIQQILCDFQEFRPVQVQYQCGSIFQFPALFSLIQRLGRLNEAWLCG